MCKLNNLVSLFALTIDRYELTKRSIETNIANAQSAAPMELLVCDNGSKDRRVVDWVAKHPLLSYHRVNSKNEGVGKAFNQLYLRAKGDILCFIGSDLELPKGWLKEVLGYVNGVPNAGIVGMDWGHGGVPPLTFQYGSHAHWLTPQLNRIFGLWCFKRELIDRVGFFPEHYDVYGMEDSSFNERVTRAGFKSLYVPNINFRCTHTGVGNEDTGEYREMKNKSLGHNCNLFAQDVAKWDTGGAIFEPLPPMREPL